MLTRRCSVARLCVACVARCLALTVLVIPLLLVEAARAATVVTVVEYYNASLDHYFITADPAEIANLDGGAFGGAWKRTGESFPAWDVVGSPESFWICRFAGTDKYRADGTRIGPNSHFYAAREECDYVKTAWQSVASDGISYPAWTFEGFAFAAAPAQDFCEHFLHRAYNNSAGGSPNHRYSDKPTLLQAMPGWTFEGLVMCLPVVSPPPPPVISSGSCLIPVPGLTAEVRNSLSPLLTQRFESHGTAEDPVETVTLQFEGAPIAESTNTYRVSPLLDGHTLLELKSTHSRLYNVIVSDYVLDGHRLRLPMENGESQEADIAISGTATSDPPALCNAPISGIRHWKYTFIGMESVTVPAGMFDACRFEFEVTDDLQTACDGGRGTGSAHDLLTIWAVGGLGQVKTLNHRDGSTTEVLWYVH